METTKKINYKFATAPVALFPITTANEFKLITYLINVANINNNSTVSVSYSYLTKAININSHHTIKKIIDSLITLNLLSRKSGNITTNNSYTINFDYINELDSKQTIDIPIEEAIIEPSVEQTIDIPTEEAIIEPSVEQIEEISTISTNEIINVNKEPINEIINVNKEPINESDPINEKELFTKITDYINSNTYESVFDNINNINEHFTKKKITYLRKHFDDYKKSNPKLINLFNKIYMAI